MILKVMNVGNMDNNCYILSDPKTKEAVIIDAPAEGSQIMDYIEEEGLSVKYILLTHAHYDHIGALDYLAESTGAKVGIHEFEKDAVCDPKVNLSLYAGAPSPTTAPTLFLVDNDTVTVGDIDLKVLYTPGHTVGSVCYYTEGFLFSGDTLFAGDVGRCDLPGGDFDILKESIQKQLYILPGDTDVFPGHGRRTNLAYEKKHNNYVRQE